MTRKEFEELQEKFHRQKAWDYEGPYIIKNITWEWNKNEPDKFIVTIDACDKWK